VSQEDEGKDEEKEPVPAASLDSSSMPDKDASALSNDVQLEVRKKEVAANQSDAVAASAGHHTLEGGVEGQQGKEGRNRADVKGTRSRLSTPFILLRQRKVAQIASAAAGLQAYSIIHQTFTL